MSLVHIKFVLKKELIPQLLFDVISPDFSQKETEYEIIGELNINLELKSFEFTPSRELTSRFCPPEYFEKKSGNIEAVSDICAHEELNCTAWSYRIYRKAKQVIEANSKER